MIKIMVTIGVVLLVFAGILSIALYSIDMLAIFYNVPIGEHGALFIILVTNISVITVILMLIVTVGPFKLLFPDTYLLKSKHKVLQNVAHVGKSPQGYQ